MSENNKLKEYVESLRTQAKELDNDKYLLAMADSIDKNQKVLSTAIEVAIATRVQAYKANTLMSERIAQLTQLVNGLIRYQQDCTDLSVAAFGLQAPKEDTQENTEEEDIISEPTEEYVPSTIEDPRESEPEAEESPAEEGLPYEEVDAPPAPKKKRKTGKVPDFTPPD